MYGPRVDILYLKDYLQTYSSREKLHFQFHLLIKALTSNTALGHSFHLTVLNDPQAMNARNTFECNR